MVSHETIYQWIWQDKRMGGELHKRLRRQGVISNLEPSKNGKAKPSVLEQKFSPLSYTFV